MYYSLFIKSFASSQQRLSLSKLNKYSICCGNYSTAQRYLGPKFTEKCVKKPMHTRAIFSNARKKRARKKLIYIYEAFFCLTLNGVLYLEQRRDSIEVTLRGFDPKRLVSVCFRNGLPALGGKRKKFLTCLVLP